MSASVVAIVRIYPAVRALLAAVSKKPAADVLRAACLKLGLFRAVRSSLGASALRLASPPGPQRRQAVEIVRQTLELICLSK